MTLCIGYIFMREKLPQRPMQEDQSVQSVLVQTSSLKEVKFEIKEGFFLFPQRNRRGNYNYFLDGANPFFLLCQIPLSAGGACL